LLMILIRVFVTQSVTVILTVNSLLAIKNL
jgi:hypothetical protein